MAEKLNMESNDLSQEHIRQIQQLFPNVVIEIKKNGKTTLGIDFDVLKQELSNELIDDKQERYQMTWPDKKKAMLLANSKINGTLRPLKEKSVDFDNTKNIYIEGDNLDVLKLLRETYLNKVKMIYIDPPYNTGNDFIYNDDFKKSFVEYNANSGQYDEQGNRMVLNNESNGRFHTDWLNMMYPRLKVARDLLTDDGVIFISIDDNEVDNLKKICDEIYGEDNFIGQWNWFKSATPPNLSFKIKKNIEYILCYEKNKDNIKFIGKKKASSSNDPFTKPQNSMKILEFPKNTITTNLKDGIYKSGIYGTAKFPNELLNDLIIKNGKNINDVKFKNKFIWTQETLNDNIKLGLRIDLSKQLVLSYKKSNYSPECPPNFIDNTVDVETTENAGTYLEKMFGKKVFDYPKPTSLIKYLLEFKNDKNAIIMDFFSGSATTAEAIINLNSEDRGNRKFILVQIPENLDENYKLCKSISSRQIIQNAISICDEIHMEHYLTNIAEERIRRAGKKIKDELIEKKNDARNLNDDVIDPDSLDIGFRVFKLDSSNMNDVYYNPNQTQKSILDATIDNIKSGRTGLDLLFQVMLELGVELSAKIEEKDILGKKCYFVNDNKIVACFDDNLTNDLLTEIANTKPTYAVFKDSCFSNDSVAINNEQIFKTYSPSTKVKVL